MHSDFFELLQLLNGHKVKYLLIGGYAYGLHVEPRYTKDIDLWVEASAANGRRLLRALEKFGAPIDNLSVEDLATPGLIYVFGIPPVRVDILNRVPGQSFAEAYRQRVKFKVDTLAIPVVSRADLILLKRAAGRPQDLADLKKLTATGSVPQKKKG